MKDAWIEVPVPVLIMAFRYALNRNTSAPWFVCEQIKIHWDFLGEEFQRQIKKDIEFQMRLTSKETKWANKLSEDWLTLRSWIMDKEKHV
jgi:uncharacterized membrane protein required for colicin V production